MKPANMHETQMIENVANTIATSLTPCLSECNGTSGQGCPKDFRGGAMMTRIESPYLTCEEAAMYLRTTKQGIYSLVKRGRLKPMPGSGKLLFTRAALDECLLKRLRR